MEYTFNTYCGVPWHFQFCVGAVLYFPSLPPVLCSCYIMSTAFLVLLRCYIQSLPFSVFIRVLLHNGVQDFQFCVGGKPAHLSSEK